MSALGNPIMYCVPYSDVTEREKKRTGRRPMKPADRLHAAVIKRGRIISLAEHQHELALPDQDAVLRLVLADPALGLINGPGTGSKLVVPIEREDEDE